MPDRSAFVILPFFEANQGLFSFLALLAALGLAWVEYRRARVAEVARSVEPAESGSALLSSLVSVLEKGTQSEELGQRSKRHAESVLPTLQNLAAQPLPSAEVMITLSNAARALRSVVDSNISYENDERRIAAIRAQIKLLGGFRDEFDALVRKLKK